MTKAACEDTFLIKKRKLSDNYYSLTFGSFKGARHCRPGNFVHLRLPSSNLFFRRAMSIAAAEPDKQELEIIFKVVGRGTAQMAEYVAGTRMDVLGPLGNAFTLPGKYDTVVIVAGGVGYPPLAYFAEHLIAKGIDPRRINYFYGGRSEVDLVDRLRIKRMGLHLHACTDDGSFGRKGLVTTAVEEFAKDHPGEKLRLYGCGPEAMLKAVDELGVNYDIPGELSLEAPMPCGIGVCLGCIVSLRKGGHARVCHDGPVFRIGEVLL